MQLHVLRLEYLFFQNFVPASQSIEEHHSIIQALQKQDEKQIERNDDSKLASSNERNTKNNFYEIKRELATQNRNQLSFY